MLTWLAISKQPNPIYFERWSDIATWHIPCSRSITKEEEQSPNKNHLCAQIWPASRICLWPVVCLHPLERGGMIAVQVPQITFEWEAWVIPEEEVRWSRVQQIDWVKTEVGFQRLHQLHMWLCFTCKISNVTGKQQIEQSFVCFLSLHRPLKMWVK
jgi:hypothetical protein